MTTSLAIGALSLQNTLVTRAGKKDYCKTYGKGRGLGSSVPSRLPSYASLVMHVLPLQEPLKNAAAAEWFLEDGWRAR